MAALAPVPTCQHDILDVFSLHQARSFLAMGLKIDLLFPPSLNLIAMTR